MSTVRHLFTARAARPKVEASMRALVQTAVYLASADGQIEESEIEALVDALRAVMVRTVGAENVDEYASLAVLLDEARAARRALAAQGEAAYLQGIEAVLEGDFRTDAIELAREVVRANGKTSTGEARALHELARVFKLPAGAGRVDA